MAHGTPDSGTPAHEHPPAAQPGLRARRKGAPAEPLRLLLIMSEGKARSTRDALLASGAVCEHVGTIASARAAIADRPTRYDALIAAGALPDGAGTDLIGGDAEGTGMPPLVLLAPDATLEDAVDALRAGAADLISGPCAGAEMTRRVLAAARRGAQRRALAREVERLKRTCRRLSASRKQIAAQVDSLCNDLADAYQELNDHMRHTESHSEFAAGLRLDLDVESLLRTCLEYVLKQVGPTNAAVFLPGGTGDFALGAYVNYDVPKDSVDVLLDHLADSLPARFERETRVQRFDALRPLRSRLGDDADWLHDSAALVFTCRSEGECLAVGVLFRDATRTFTDDQMLTMQTIADTFGEALARVVRVHHRHKPGKAFPHFGAGEDDLAA